MTEAAREFIQPLTFAALTGRKVITGLWDGDTLSSAIEHIQVAQENEILVVAPATSFTHAPAGWSHAAAATLTTAGVTAWRALVVNGGLKVGDSVLVLGTGGVSIFALQIARAMGATVIATSSSDEKLERLRAMGAAHGIDDRRHEDWGDRVRELTGGTGVDLDTR